MNDIENRMVLDRAWPALNPMSRAERIDELATDSKFRDWNWLDGLDTDDLKEIVAEACHAAWRGDYQSDTERIMAVRASLESAIDAWAEEEIEHED